jgi:hypothetical protein
VNRLNATWLSGAMFALTTLLVVATLIFTARHPLSGEHSSTDAIAIFVSILIVGSFATVGAVVAARRPSNPIGWIFSSMALLFAAAILLGNYGEHGLVVVPGSLAGAEIAAWTGNWIWPVALAPVGFLFLLFPDGRPPSARWGAVGWVLAGAMLGWFIAWAFMPGPLTNAGYEQVDNPYGVEGLGALLKPLGAVSGLLLLAGVLASVVSTIGRFRRSIGEERSQLKWLAYAGGVVVLTAAVSLTAESSAGESASVLIQVLQLALVGSLCTVPIATGIAVLKYRLYDIDRIINRSLVYGVVTVLLAVGYAGGVLVAQAILPLPDDSPAVVAITTLAVVALFRPLRSRVQGFVDRRFYRRRYDAARTIESFGSRLRQETDLDSLRTELLSLVNQTMQPAHASLWLRSKGRG